MRKILYVLATFFLISMLSCEKEKEYVPTDSIILNVDKVNLLVDEQFQLTATINPEDATERNIIWSSEDNTIATVSNSGLVTAVGYGATTIVAKIEDIKISCQVKVLNSCDDGGVTLQVGNIIDDSPIFHFEGGDDSVSISGPLEWISFVRNGADWCSIQKNGNSLIVSTSENKSSKIRETQVIVASGHQKKVITIYQAPQVRKIKPYPSRRVRMQEKVKWSDRSMSEIAVFMPFPETCEYQTINNLVYNSPGEVFETEERNARYVLFRKFPKERTGSFTCTLEFTVTSNLVEVDFDKITRYFDYDKTSTLYSRYTSTLTIDGKKYIDPENPVLSEAANKLWEQNDGDILNYCKSCYDYVAKHFEYMYGGNGVINDIIERGGGDCGNITNLCLSMIRNKGIPCRALVMQKPKNDNHVRMEFYLAGYGWIPLDPTYHMNGDNYFGRFTDNYIVMNRDCGLTCNVEGWNWTPQFVILQGCNWYWWCNSDGGDVLGEYNITTIK